MQKRIPTRSPRKTIAHSTSTTYTNARTKGIIVDSRPQANGKGIEVRLMPFHVHARDANRPLGLRLGKPSFLGETQRWPG
jgi:hypothetical protein